MPGKRPLLPDHDPEQQVDCTVQEQPGCIMETDHQGHHDAKNAAKDQKQGDEQRQGLGRGSRIGHHQESHHEIESPAEQIDKEPAPGFRGEGMKCLQNADHDQRAADDDHRRQRQKGG